MRKGIIGILILFVVSFTVSGCGGTVQNTDVQKKPQEAAAASPVTLKLMQFSTELTDGDFQRQIAGPVHKKYPNITIELMHAAKGITPDTIVTSGDVPDIVFTGSLQLVKFVDIGFALDLNPLVKKYDVDPGSFDPLAYGLIKDYGKKGELFAMPFSEGFSALFYNKDIFDKFGVPYPKDQMTWDQVIDLGAKVARTDGGTVYKPLNAGFFKNFAAPYQTHTVDPATMMAHIDTDAYRKALAMFKKVTDLPGNSDSYGNGRNKFMKDKNLAMLPDFSDELNLIVESVKAGDTLNWDAVSYPSFKDAPNKGYEQIITQFIVYLKTKHPDEVMQALQVIVSPDNQLNVTRSGSLSVLKDLKYKQNFGADLPELNGKNIQGIFKSSPTPATRISLYENLGGSAVNSNANKVAAGKLDINTALRTAEEEANKKLADVKAK